MTDTVDLAKRLLDAHVVYELQRFDAASLPEMIEREVEALFAWAADATLDDVATREQINSVIDRYVVELKISGALTELAGEMSSLVVTSKLSEQIRVDQVLQPDEFAQFADKLTGLEKLWRELLHLVVQSDAYARLLSSTLQRGALDVLFRETSGAAGHSLLEGLLTKLRPLIAQRLEPHLSALLERLIKHSVRHTEERLMGALDPEAMRALVDEVWDEVGPMRLSDAFKLIGSHDLEDFVVLGYEFWQRYRKTRYFREISRELVDYFFTKYSGESLLSLLDEVGVTSQMVIEELQGFVPPLLAHARQTGLIEQRIRAHLEGFYASEAAIALTRTP